MYILRSWLNFVRPNSTLNSPPSRISNGRFKKVKESTWTTRPSVSRLIARYEDILQEKYGDQEDELMAILESLKDKQSDLKKINRDIVELLSEDELENEVTPSDKIDMNIRLGIQKISKELKSKKSKDKELESNTTQ